MLGTTPATSPLRNAEELAWETPAIETNPPRYYATDRSAVIRQVDPTTGVTSVLTSAPFPVEGVAYDRDRDAVYYLERPGSGFRLGRYDAGLDTHTVLGDLQTAGSFYTPLDQPRSMVFYAGSLYYVAPGTDDLVRIQLSGSGIASEQKMADLSGNVSSWSPSAMAINNAGLVFFSDGSRFMRYDLRGMTGFTQVSAAATSWQALVFNDGTSALHGAAVTTATRIDTVSTGNGAGAPGVATAPVVALAEITGPNSAPTPATPAYYASNRTNRLYTINPVTGATALLSGTAAYSVDSIAFDQSSGVIYALENTDSNTRLGRYVLATNLFSNIGQLMDRSFGGVNVPIRPFNLAFYAGDLYYIRRSSTTAERDDLMRIVFTVSGITAHEKVLDLNNNVSFGDVAACTITDDGTLWFSTASQLYRYDLRNRTGLAAVSSSFTQQNGLLWRREDNQLYGSRSTATNSIGSVAMATGVLGSLFTTSPSITIADLASGNTAPPPPWFALPPVYAVGDFSRTSDGQFRNVARFGPTGELDPSFAVGAGTNAGSSVRALTRTANGSVVIGGDFSSVSGVSRGALARLNPNGSLDTSFAPQISQAVGGPTGTLFTIDWSTIGFAQHEPLDGTDTKVVSPSTYLHGMSNAGGFTGFGQQTFGNVAGSGLNMTVYYSQNMTGIGGLSDGSNVGPSLHGPAGSGALAGPNPDRRVTGPWALRMTSDRNGAITPTTMGVSFSEPVFIDSVIVGGISTVLGKPEHALFRAFSGANGGGTLVPAETYENISDLNGPLLGSLSDPLTVNALSNVIMDPNPADRVYWTIGDGAEESARYGRVRLRYNSTAAQSFALSTWASPPSSQTGFDPDNPFGVAEYYNVFVFEDFTHESAAVMGAVAVGGDLTVSNFGMAQHLDNSWYGFDTLVVGGTMDFNGGAVHEGNVAYAAATTTDLDVKNGMARQEAGVIDFDGLRTQLLALSGFWKGLPTTPGASVTVTSSGNLEFDAANLPGLVVINATHGQFASAKNLKANNVAPSATLLINVNGNAITGDDLLMSINGNGVNPQEADRVVLHLPDANNIRMNRGSVHAALFAPRSNLIMDNGTIHGTVIVKNFTGMNGGIIMHRTFIGDDLPGTWPPSGDPASLLLQMSGFRRATTIPGAVWAVAEQPDGKLVIGGRFNFINGTARRNIARLNPDGSLDATFDPGSGPNGDVLAVDVLANGSIMAGGDFSAWNGSSAGAKAVLLTSSGARDTSWTSTLSVASTDTVRWIRGSASGIYLGGRFSVGGVTKGVARFTTSGALDGAFATGSGTGTGTVHSGVVLGDGSVLISGDFTTVNGTARNRVARLTPSGAVDTTFNPGSGFDGLVATLMQTPGSGFTHAGGTFSNYNGTARSKMAVFGNANGSLPPGTWGPAGMTISTINNIR